MNQTDMSNAEDFSDLGFDMEPHRETFISFAKMNLAAIAVKPTLRARDTVVVRFPGTQFALRVTDDPARQEAEEIRRGSIAFAVIHQAESAEGASQVRAEVERYFLRHFPGRTLAEAKPPSPSGHYVYIVCFEASP